MKIILDLQACQSSSRRRGIGRYAYECATAILSSEHNHHILVALNASLIDSSQKLIDHFTPLLKSPEDLVLFHAPLKGDKPLQLDLYLEMQKDIFEIYHPDLVHCFSLFESDPQVVTGNCSSSKSYLHTCTLHDLIPAQYEDTYLQDKALNRNYRSKLYQLNKFDALFSVSEYSKLIAEDLAKIPSRKIFNVFSAASDFFEKIARREVDKNHMRELGIKQNFIMNTGGNDPRKNTNKLIEAYSMLESNIKETYQLVLVRTATILEKEEIDKTIKKLGISRDSVVVTGYISDHTLRMLYNTCSVFVFPSLCEGFGIPVVEAMRCGAPTIVSDNSSLLEIVQDERAFFQAKCATSIASKITDVLSDKNFAQSLSEAGYERTRHISWMSVAHSFITACEELLDRKNHNAIPQKIIRLALFSPVPPQKSGIADYTADLVPHLSMYYHIDIVTDCQNPSDWALSAHAAIISYEEFTYKSESYDRIHYMIGNSTFHSSMFKYIKSFPGTVTLHDFYLTGVFNYLDVQYRGYFLLRLFRSHGFSGLLEEQHLGRQETIEKFPCNLEVCTESIGVIVHSKHAKELGQKFYGEKFTQAWQKIDHLRYENLTSGQAEIRKQLGLEATTLLVCTFGHFTPRKYPFEILEAWDLFCQNYSGKSMLLFIGEINDTREALDFLDLIKFRNNVKATGFTTKSEYKKYHIASDITIQLRRNSNGETSGALYDALASSTAVIVNNHGSFQEIPEICCLKIPDNFSVRDLYEAIQRLTSNPSAKMLYKKRGLQFVGALLHPNKIANDYHQCIENFYRSSPHVSSAKSIVKIAKFLTDESRNKGLERHLLGTLVRKPLFPRVKSIYVDISALINLPSAQSRKLVKLILSYPITGYKIEFVSQQGNNLILNRSFILTLLRLQKYDYASNSPLVPRAEDVFLGLFSSPTRGHRQTIASYRLSSVYVVLCEDIILSNKSKGVCRDPDFRAACANSVYQQANQLFFSSSESMFEYQSYLKNEGNLCKAQTQKIHVVECSCSFLGALDVHSPEFQNSNCAESFVEYVFSHTFPDPLIVK